MHCWNPGGFFKRKGYSFETRKHLFYGVCIPLRIFIGLLIFFLFDIPNKELHISISAILIALGFYTMLNTISCLRDNVWWHRKFEALVALTLITMGFLNIFQDLDGKYLAIPIFIDILYGIILSTRVF